VALGAVWVRALASLRSHRRSWLALTVLAGVAGGVAITAAAGARRTETAYPRFVEGTRSFDVFFSNGTGGPNTNRQFDLDEIARLPQVVDSARANYYFLDGHTDAGRPIHINTVSPMGSPDRRFGSEINRLVVLDGRLARARNELAVTFVASERLHVGAGDTVTMKVFGPQAVEEGFRHGAQGIPDVIKDTPEQRFRVVGVVAMQGTFPPSRPSTAILPPVIFSPAFARSDTDAVQIMMVRLRHGRADVPTFERELQRLAKGSTVFALTESEQTPVVQRSLTVQATVLRFLAAVVAVVSFLLLGQSFVRQSSLDAGDSPVLRALGMTESQVARLGVARAVVLAPLAGVVALVTAVATSPLTPVGVARQAEIHPGIELNLVYLAVGVAATVLFVGALCSLTGWLSARAAAADEARTRPSFVATAVAATGLPVAALAGVRMALEPGRGRRAVPVRTAIVGAGVAAATVAAILGFSASLDRLFDKPALYGWNWDAQVGGTFAGDFSEAASRLASDRAIGGIALGAVTRVQVDGVRVDALGTERSKGKVSPTVVEGRAARSADEILLGTRTLRQIHRHVGDTVLVTAGDVHREMRVVGRGVLSEFAGAARLGEGAAMTFDGLRAFVPESIKNLMLLRYAPGADHAAVSRRLDQAFEDNVYRPAKPTDLATLDRTGGTPLAVTLLLGLMAAATLVHALVSSVRRRRHDLAILKTIGFMRRQVSVAVVWQATTIALVAVIVGIPIGAAAGRWSWSAFADGLGVPADPATPLLAMVLLAVAILALANLAAAVPGVLAADLQPAVALRAE
jgi:ABC-type lipoprotein release transport system permease subunit